MKAVKRIIRTVLFYAVFIISVVYGLLAVMDHWGPLPVFILLLVFSVGLTFLITKTIYSPDTDDSREGKEKIKLSKLAPIWMEEAKTTGEPRGKFSARERGMQGRDPEDLLKEAEDAPGEKPTVPAQAPEPKNYAFRHPEVLKFYKDVTLPERNGFDYEPVLLRLVEEYLDMLDRLGDCPSVVESTEREYDNDLKRYDAASGKSFWDILKGVSLLQHSTRVARIVEKSATLPDTTPVLVVAALGHDIGKIPTFRNDPRYAVGSHPSVGMLVTKQETCFWELPDSVQEDIEHAIMNHHNKAGLNPVPPCTALIQDADRQARKEELMENTAQAERHRIENFEMFSTQKAHGLPSDDDDGLWEQKKKSSLKAGDYDLGWLDSRKVLSIVKPHINRMENGIFRAISMREGTKRFIVYAQVNLLREKADTCAKSLVAAIDLRLGEIRDDEEARALKAKRALIMGFIVGEIDRDSQKAKSLALVDKLRSERLVLEDLVAHGFYGAYFSIHYENGQIYDKYYAVPLRGEAFGSEQEIEARKKGLEEGEKIFQGAEGSEEIPPNGTRKPLPERK